MYSQVVGLRSRISLQHEKKAQRSVGCEAKRASDSTEPNRDLVYRPPSKSLWNIFCVMRQGKPSRWVVAVTGERDSMSGRGAVGGLDVWTPPLGGGSPSCEASTDCARPASTRQLHASRYCAREPALCVPTKTRTHDRPSSSATFWRPRLPYTSRGRRVYRGLAFEFLKAARKHVPATNPTKSGPLHVVAQPSSTSFLLSAFGIAYLRTSPFQCSSQLSDLSVCTMILPGFPPASLPKTDQMTPQYVTFEND